MKTTTMNKNKAVWMFLALILALPALGHAEEGAIGDKMFSIGPRATYVNPKGADKSVWYGGAQARLHLAKALALEGSIDYYRVLFNADYRLKIYPVQASLLAYLTPQYRVSPFILGGAGWYFSRLEGPNDTHLTKDRFGVHAGGGLEAKLNDSISLDGTYRYVWVEDMRTKDLNAVDKKYNGGGSMITAALNFHFF